MAFLHGLGFGLLMMFFIGPVFFYLLQTSLQFGTKSGIIAALGIVFSDFCAVFLCYFWASKLFEGESTQNEFWLALIGGFIILFFGIGYIFKPKFPINKPIEVKKADYVTFFTKAFLINFVNPFVFLVWISMIGVARNTYGKTELVMAFLAAALLGIVSTDILKVVGAKYLKRIIEPHVLIKVYKIIGIILILFSTRLFYHAASL